MEKISLNRKIGESEQGFIKMTILIVVALVILKYAYDVDIVNYLTQIWEKYGGPIINAWHQTIDFIKNIFT